MGIREIPRSFEYECDGCGAKHLQQNAGGHYTDSRPPYWTRLKMARTAYDYQGSACADASFERLLCRVCSDKLIAAINATFAKPANQS